MSESDAFDPVIQVHYTSTADDLCDGLRVYLRTNFSGASNLWMYALSVVLILSKYHKFSRRTV